VYSVTATATNIVLPSLLWKDMLFHELHEKLFIIFMRSFKKSEVFGQLLQRPNVMYGNVCAHMALLVTSFCSIPIMNMDRWDRLVVLLIERLPASGFTEYLNNQKSMSECV